MNILKIFNKTNWEILENIRYRDMNLRDLSRKLEKSPATIHNNIKKLKKYNIISIQKQKNQYIIKPNKNSFYYQNFLRLINYENIKKCPEFQKLLKLGKAGIYGSFAKGQDEKDSDIDMFIFTEKDELEIRKVINQLSKEIGKEINLLILNKQKIENLKRKDYEFYIRLKLESITFDGEIFD